VPERYSAVAVEPGWTVEADPAGALVARKVGHVAGSVAAGRPEAVKLELYTHRFETIAREMGEALRRTAVSTNVKERLDFSCAVLDVAGELVVNAPHIPVHLGSLGLCVRRVADALDLEPGDTVVTNHPAFGGSHLPDVTLVSPVHGPDEELVGFVASRAHHAEIGGVLPGSMPASARCLADEGIVVPPTDLVRRGRADWDAVRALLSSGRYPSRAVEDNIADLRAALAANVRGVGALSRLAESNGSAVVARYMRALEDRAESGIRRALGRIADGRYAAEEVLDDGSMLKVAIDIAGDRAAFDFTGSAEVHPGNLNATEAIVRSAVLYVLRLLIDEPLPLNEGLLRAVTLTIPTGILNPDFSDDPMRAPAVVGGNVETSQRLVNACLRALGLAASSQGTMNNVLFGDARQSYYETVCGGCGAGPGFHGASAVHSHMTNTRITDPELIEHRHPVRIERFAVRRGSGGAGRFSGGDGVSRQIRFLAPLTLSVLSQHRNRGPAGLAGGSAGRPGAQWVVRAAGQREVLGAVDSTEVEAGDLLVLETPGGGGFGEPEPGGAGA
jgi:5-oxoprolinase (ATP-hydrolysing)